MRPFLRDRIAVGLIAAGILLVDQASKWMLVASLPLNGRIEVIDGLFALTHVQNRGAAFGLFADVPSEMLRWVLVVVSLAAVGLIWAYAREGWHRPSIVAAFGAILGGALGNLVDRSRLGYVVDFLDIHWRGYHWPSFNVADAAITIGALILFIAMARQGEGPETPAHADAGRHAGAVSGSELSGRHELVTADDPVDPS